MKTWESFEAVCNPPKRNHSTFLEHGGYDRFGYPTDVYTGEFSCRFPRDDNALTNIEMSRERRRLRAQQQDQAVELAAAYLGRINRNGDSNRTSKRSISAK